MRITRHIALVLTLALLTATAVADWPQWGRDETKNMADPTATNLPDTFNPGELDADEQVDMSTTENIKWAVKLGSQSYGNVTVANGRVYVGTNNDFEEDERFQGDFSLVVCFDEKTGKKLWKLTVPKMGSGKVGDWEYLGICSSPTVDGDRVYVVTNRCEVLCLDVNGQANGNDGPYTEEAQYFIGPGKEAVEVKADDADIIWRYDMGDDLGVFPHNVTSSSALVVGDKVWVCTSNGVDWSHKNIPNPLAPSFVCLDKMTGALAGEEDEHVSDNILHGGWSSPARGVIDGQGYVYYTGPDGWLYAFKDNEFGKDEDGFVLFKLAWKLDGNPPSMRYRVKDPTWIQEGPGKFRVTDPTPLLNEKGDKQYIKYVKPDGPNEFISSPVFYKGRIYAAAGQDPEHGEGMGNMVCVDGKTGKVVWHYPLIYRAISTVAIVDDVVYLGDYSGYTYAFDANTGELFWRHDTQSHIWGSPLVADGKMWIGNEDGILTVVHLAEMKALADKQEGILKTRIKSKRYEVEVDGETKRIRKYILEMAYGDGETTEMSEEERSKFIREIEMPGAVLASPITANGVLFLHTHTHLYAIAKPQAPAE